jgi:hypothetical protein
MRPIVICACVALSAAAGARAQNLDCDDAVNLPNPIFMQIGDTQEPLIKTLGQALRESTVKPMTLIYFKSSSCVNVDTFESFSLLSVNPLYIPSVEQDPSWNPTKATPTCNIAAGGVPLDVANSATFISSCTLDPAPSGVVRIRGAVQGYAFVAPTGNSETVLTAEEAYFVYGFGQAGQIAPYDNDLHIFKRPTTASTLLTLMANIDVPIDRAKGVEEARSGNLITAITTSPTPADTIGILGVELADRNRSTMHTLAFRAFEQKHAYFPDSTSTSFDKQNVRDGHYVPWSPTDWMYYVDSTGKPLNADAKYLVDLIAGNDAFPPPDFDALALEISTGLVPICAMKVTRAFDGGDLSLFTPAEPCGCFFESQVDVPGPECVQCTDNSPCGAGACRHGFCEAH